MNLPYFAADTLGVTLYLIKNRLTASETHPLLLGPWRVDMDVDVQSDIFRATELGFWVILEKTLRLYVIIREKESWLLVLNTRELQKCGEKTGFAGELVKDRIAEIKPAIKGTFRWKNDAWEHVQYDGSPMEG
jgi:hypothetical protein